MALEIERKFLVTGEEWRQTPGTKLAQGYLNRDPERTVRVRIAGEQAFLTIKGLTRGMVREEFEYPIPKDDAEQLLKLSEGPFVEKIRRKIQVGKSLWEVDEFQGANQGLVVAEIELPDETTEFDRPTWLGAEVTNDTRYLNSNLSKHPYRNWR